MKLESNGNRTTPFRTLPSRQRPSADAGKLSSAEKAVSMEFYYPNWNNDMWRITGFLFFNDKDYFINKTKKAFCKDAHQFPAGKGIALFDTASAIRRLQDNASDKFLEVVQPTDVPALLHRIPQCKAIVTTGEKATDTLCTQFSIDKPKVGDFTEFLFENHPMRLYRMPSSSRAYPLALEKSSSVSHYVSGLTDVVSNFL